MSEPGRAMLLIARKDMGDAARSHMLWILGSFLLLASIVALAIAALALRIDVANYNEGRDALLALGRPLAAIPSAEFFPLKLLRGFIEHIEIIGSVLGIILGYRGAAVERGNSTVALILSRPVSPRTLLAGKALGAIALIVGLDRRQRRWRCSPARRPRRVPSLPPRGSVRRYRHRPPPARWPAR